MNNNIKKIIRKQVEKLYETFEIDRGHAQYNPQISGKVITAIPKTKGKEAGYDLSIFDYDSKKTTHDWIEGSENEIKVDLKQKYPQSRIIIKESRLLTEVDVDVPVTKGIETTLKKYIPRRQGQEKFAKKLKPQNIEAAERLINNILKLGRAAKFNYDFIKSDLHADIFDYVMESIIEKWITADPKTKKKIEEAITEAYNPYSPRLNGIIMNKVGTGFYKHPELPEALAEAWSKIFGDLVSEYEVKDSDKTRKYSSFSGYVISSMVYDLMDYFKLRKAKKTVSYDYPEPGEFDITRYAAPEEPEYDNAAAIFRRFKKASEKVADWFDKNQPRKESILFRSIVCDALTAEEILEAYADEEPNPLVDRTGKPLNMKTVQIAFNNMMLKKPLAKEIGEQYAEADPFFRGDDGEPLIVPNRSGKDRDGKPNAWNYGKFVKQVHAPTSGREAAQESLAINIAESIIKEKKERFEKLLLENIMKRIQK